MVTCRVESGAGDPCTNPAKREVMGVPLCEAHAQAHAREQEVCFDLGKVAEACGIVSDWEKQARCRNNEPLLEILGTVRLELDGRIAKQRELVRACGVRS